MTDTNSRKAVLQNARHPLPRFRQPGQPRTAAKLRALIARMVTENRWGGATTTVAGFTEGDPEGTIDRDHFRAPATPDGNGELLTEGRGSPYRRYKRAKYKDGKKSPTDDMWLVELGYETIFDPPPGMNFDPRQRVAFVAELFDEGRAPLDPQAAMQALPIASSLIRLSTQALAVRAPVIIRPRS